MPATELSSKSLRPSQIIAMQREIINEQEAIIDVLKAALGADAVTPAANFPDWLKGLTRQERALVAVLHRHYPSPIGRYELLELLPGRDHVDDRQAQIVTVLASSLRKKLGADAIENVRGEGYKLGLGLYERMSEPSDAPLRLRLAA